MRGGGRPLPMHVAPRRAMMAGTERHYSSTLEARCAHNGCARFAHDVASPWRGVSHDVAARFVDGAAADRPPLRRVSGDVVTAGLNSSRVWFGPVPGSP
ncbi:hypothetical protein F511_46219 [Dorcoceras hygrometricum]|uniref:Uncharacterized protein n=1 Tax=Dorcoceras hygrometricum TaxID=472368 RepID=A0A2Z6ZU25_9LAMI|nr:hypothetical protein F511_46219 [Dorcoceras hygrometricum]